MLMECISQFRLLQYHRLGGLGKRHLFLSFGGLKAETRRPAGLGSW